MARWMERFGSGRRRRRAEIGVPENTLWPIFSTTAPSEPPENTLCPIFSTYCGQRGLGRAAAPTAPVRDARHGRNASWPNAVVVKTRVYWRVESRKIRLYGQNRPSLEVNAAERPRIPACESPAPVAAAAKPQFRRPRPEAWSKLAFSVPTVKAGFDHGAPQLAAETRRLRGAAAPAPPRAPAGRAQPQPEASRTKPAPIAAGHDAAARRTPTAAAARPRPVSPAICGGFVRRTRRWTNHEQPGRSMGTLAHRPSTAAFPQVATRKREPAPEARGRSHPPAPPAGRRTPPKPDTPPTLRAPRPVGSFDSGGFAACAQDDKGTSRLRSG